jgi:hypothetical protein
MKPARDLTTECEDLEQVERIEDLMRTQRQMDELSNFSPDSDTDSTQEERTVAKNNTR